MVVAALGILFLGGAAVGLGLAAGLASGSWLAEVVSFFALPFAFALGLQAWYGLALLSLIPRIIGWVKRNGSAVSESHRAKPQHIPGTIVFLPLSSGIGALAGVVVGLVSSTHSFWSIVLIYWLVGTLHGLVAWRLARAGVLLPPESI